MSAEMGLNTTNTIYVELLDEGTFVMRPAEGRQVCGNMFEILAPPNYDPDLETWKFVPGSMVECEWEERGGEKFLVAKRAAAS